MRRSILGSFAALLVAGLVGCNDSTPTTKPASTSGTTTGGSGANVQHTKTGKTLPLVPTPQTAPPPPKKE